MRQAFIKALTYEAKKNNQLLLLTADLGYQVVEEFEREFPQRFINMGVAEANMIAVASGLAMCGKIPFVYSIATFLTMRCFEQIRNDVCLHKANVKIVGVGGGLQYAQAGSTHHALEDIAIMRTLPGMTIICPADPVEAYQATIAACRHYGPVYLRLGKSGEKNVLALNYQFRLGKGAILRQGADILLLATGSMVSQALEISQILAQNRLETTVVNLSTVKPLDKDLIIFLTKKIRRVFTLEEHYLIGGLGSAVAEVIALSNLTGIKFKSFGIKDKLYHHVGSWPYLKDKLNLSTKKITLSILNNL